tara:strand:- start:567 stop:974 length:408 start_codon:yes stop_codon:yes gene_type:complete
MQKPMKTFSKRQREPVNISSVTLVNSNCFYCHKKGHWKNDCPKLLKKKINTNVKKLESMVESIEHDFPELSLTATNLQEHNKKFNYLKVFEEATPILPIIAPAKDDIIEQTGSLHLPIKKIHNWADCDTDSEDDN